MNGMFEDFERRLQHWAEAQADVRVVIIIGSRARAERPADAWSDLDVLLFVEDPGVYVGTSEWLHALGTVWLTFIERTATGDAHERRALYAGGVDVDFVPLPVELIRGEMPPQAAAVLRGGYRLLVDKEACAAKLQAVIASLSALEASRPPDLLNVAQDFWYHCVWTAKKLRRGELWMALGSLNSYMMWNCLLPIIEAHARQVYGADHSTWFQGRFLDDWAAPDAQAGLRDAGYASYDEADAWRVLLARMAWFEQMAAALDIPGYPLEATRQVRAYVESLARL